MRHSRKTSKTLGSICGPAEGGKGMLKTGERQAHHVKVAAFDAGNVAAGATLDAITACFVMCFAGREIAVDLFRGERGELHQGGLDEGASLGVRKADKGDSGEDGVREAGKLLQHAAGIVGGARLAKDVAFQSHDGVGSDDDGWANRPGRDQLSLGSGQALDEIVRGFARVRRFVNGGGHRREWYSGVAKNAGAAFRTGSKDQLHKNSGQEEYYSASAVTACALVQPKRRAICTAEAEGYRVRYFTVIAVRASSREILRASATCRGKARATRSKRLEAHASVSCRTPECVTISRPCNSNIAFLKRLLPVCVSNLQACRSSSVARAPCFSNACHSSSAWWLMRPAL